MKKNLTVLCATLLLASVLSGCSAPLKISINRNDDSRRTEETTSEASDSGSSENYTYLMDSDTRLLGNEDLEGKTDMELRLIKNEILARHGFVFSDDATMRSYFANQPWYTPDPYFTSDQLEGIELANFVLIRNKLASMQTTTTEATTQATTVVVQYTPAPVTPATQPQPQATVTYYCCASDFATLRSAPSTSASAITRIYTRGAVTYLGRSGSFLYVSYGGTKGYVLAKFFSTNYNAPLNYDER
jgi:hypothetical protein